MNGNGQEAKLFFMGHVMMENRNKAGAATRSGPSRFLHY
jgi:hypothetical protein